MRARHGLLKVLLGALVLGAVIVPTALSPWLSPYDPNAQVLSARLRPPSWWARLACIYSGPISSGAISQAG